MVVLKVESGNHLNLRTIVTWKVELSDLAACLLVLFLLLTATPHILLLFKEGVRNCLSHMTEICNLHISSFHVLKSKPPVHKFWLALEVHNSMTCLLWLKNTWDDRGSIRMKKEIISYFVKWKDRPENVGMEVCPFIVVPPEYCVFSIWNAKSRNSCKLGSSLSLKWFIPSHMPYWANSAWKFPLLAPHHFKRDLCSKLKSQAFSDIFWFLFFSAVE